MRQNEIAAVPTEEYIANLWASVKAGTIDWTEVRRLQAETMPRCELHGKPANVRIGAVYLCEVCIAERGDGRR
jgi:hypothetical protein